MPKPNKYGSPYDPNNKPADLPRKKDRIRMSIKSNDYSAFQTFEEMVLNNIFSGVGIDPARGSSWMSGIWPDTDHIGDNTLREPARFRQTKDAVKKWLIAAPEQAFDDIIGNDEALTQLRDAIQAPITQKDLYAAYGMTMPKGALLSGAPGCGKTMFARAAASEMKTLHGATEFICLSGSELQSGYVGQTEQRIKEIFAFAREYKAYKGHPLLVFIDEAEVLFPDRTGRTRQLHSWEESRVATFLAEMDGIQASGAFILLATNRPESIDQALLRDGRCDFKISIKRPTMQAAEIILQRAFGQTPVAEKHTLGELVMTAIEGLFDPHKILHEEALIAANLAERKVTQVKARHFLLEHIVSGAMVASIPARAKRYAFARDKASGTVSGVTVADVHSVINDLFNENRTLEHSFALNEFRQELMAEYAPPPRRVMA